MALNDLLLINRWLIPRLQGEIPSEPAETFYLGRLASAQLFEIATFLRISHRRLPQVQEFVATLDEDDQACHAALLAIGKGGAGKFPDQLAHARHSFFHYQELLSGESEDHERLKQAMEGHAQDERDKDLRRGEIRDIPPPITGFRAIFADDIASEMTLPEDTEGEFQTFIGNVAEHSGKVLTFVRAALNAYTHTRPAETWDIEEIPDPS
jgi:hypothetical protein